MNATGENFHKPEHSVLIIDDEPANLRVIANYLEAHDIEVLIARDGEEGLEKVRYFQPDLILLDVIMPGIDGFETCRRLKSDETTRHIPVIFTTIVTGTEDKVIGFKVGSVDYITKPFQREEVLARVTTHLRLHDLARRLEEANEILERRVAKRTAELIQANQELEKRVIQRTAQLEASNKELEAFAYSVSHDMRAPLRHIDGFLELLKQRIEESLDEHSRPYMTKIAASTRRMGALIDDLLAFSRMGRSEMFTGPVDLAGMVKQVIRDLEPETKDRSIKWHIADFPATTGDQAMLHLVLTNLLSNAVKFSRERSQADIEIGFQVGQKETIIFVRDNGVGFDMAYADKLFDVFQRLHQVDKFEGTGIGLANVKRIVSRHGGRVWAEGKVNQGATFYFSLPTSSKKTQLQLQ